MPNLFGLINHERQQVIDNSTLLLVSSKCAERIMSAIENLPGKNHIKATLKQKEA